MPLNFADRLNNVETSAIRELFKLLGKPGIISFAGGFPDSAMFDVAGIQEAANKALAEEPGAALQYGATEGYNPLREQLAAFMASKGVKGPAARRADRHHRQPAGAGPAGQNPHQPRRQGDCGRPHLPGHHPVLPPVWGGGDHRAHRRAGRADGQAGSADGRAQAEVCVFDPHLWQPQRRAAEPGAPQKGAGAGREVPDAGGGRRPLRRPVLWRGPAAQHLCAERFGPRQP
jgi:hypothetical protein